MSLKSFFDSFFDPAEIASENATLKELLTLTKADGIMRIDDAFTIERRGTVLVGSFIGSIKPTDTARIVIKPMNKEAEFTSMVLGLERYRKLEDRLDSPEEEIHCGILVKAHPDAASLIGKYMLSYKK